MTAMTDTPPPAPPAHEADTLAVVAAMLDGVPPDDGVSARHFAPEAVAARTADAQARRAADWPALGRYRAANAAVASPPELVMIGDSITEIWGVATPDLFSPHVLNRGIAGQTSGQMLLRFMADVVDLAPARVHILCGTNDVAGNTGPNLPVDYQRNVRAMVDLARAHGIGVLIASIPPAGAIGWNPAARPLAFIPRLNAWLRDLAQARGLTYVDYFAALTDGEDALRAAYSADGVHVTRAAYRVMRGVLAGALADTA